MVVRPLVATGACFVAGACLQLGAYVCASNDACRSDGDQGVCQPSRYCSFADTTCDSGQRYDEFAGDGLADDCVPEEDPSTTGPDGSAGSESSGTMSSGGATSEDTGEPDPQCGNGIVEPGEDCDDDNDVDGDGCNTDCTESGTVLWDVVHPELGSVARGVAVGPTGNIAVAGGRVENEQSDVLVLLYDPEGVAQWQRTFASPADGEDEGRQATFDGEGNLYVTAFVTMNEEQPPQNVNAWTRQYDPRGSTGWTEIYNGPNNGPDRPLDVAWREGEVIVAGSSSADVWVRGYATRDGQPRWTWSTPIVRSMFDGVSSIAVTQDRVYVAGELDNADRGRDAWFAQLDVVGDPATADWIEIVDPGGVGRDTALGIDVAPDGGLVVGGRRNELAWIARYTADGTFEWERFDDTLQAPTDVRGVAVDATGQIVAVGYETDPEQGEDAFVTKYDADGTMVWTRRYDGPAGGTDRARAVAVGLDRTIAVSGFTDAVDGRRMWVRKYAP
ncbi:MAG: hypothetical protein AAF721_30640 [Myxococcota bacterium]